MNFATFDSVLWGNESFEQIGYDKTGKQLHIYFVNGLIGQFEEVEEMTVFHFLITTEKEAFIKKVLMPNYSYQLMNNPLTAQQ
ncbi:KTSC domain-containing protein [Thalassobacillus hwangdonensis]|uniref:KTSC domain-containing protein n=1 Tax=Thalassobacillus hwangdonensis TaxID=546108 RepID=A0ABW3KY80_9BACI